MAYVKLDCGMLRSTLWMDREAREVFITALLMAVPQAFDEPIPQLEVRTITKTGWSAPVGSYGFVDAAGVGIIRQAGLDQDVGMAALERLGSPEPDSRSQDHGGRRLVRIDGGYLVLNFTRYREKDHTAAERMKRYRARKKAETQPDSTALNTVPSRSYAVTQRVVTDSRVQSAEAELREREVEPVDNSPDPTLSLIAIPECPKDMDIEAENEACRAYYRIRSQGVTESRWRSWVLRSASSGIYAKRAGRPATAAEIQATRREILRKQEQERALAAQGDKP